MEVLLFIRKKMKPILIIGVICGIIAFVLTNHFGISTYTYSGKLIVNTIYGQTGAIGDQADLALAEKVLPTYVEVLKSKTFINEVKNAVGLNYSTSAISSMVDISFIENTKILNVSATSKNVSDAKKITQAILDFAPKHLAGMVGIGSIKIMDNASLSYVSSPNRMVNSLIGFFIGAILTTIFAYLIGIFDVRIKGESDVVSRYDIPVLGAIPKFNRTTKAKRRQS